MNIQAFYKALASVLSERTKTEIKVKEITENGRRQEWQRIKRRMATELNSTQ